MTQPSNLINSASALPGRPAPIIIIGAGGIVGDAHLPAYEKAGFPVFGIVNRTREKAEKLARAFAVPHVFSSLKDAVAAAPADAVYDLALMPAQYLQMLEQLPDGAAVLIQKPMGDNLDHAREIRALCRRKKLVAAVNFQLRYAPFVTAARRLIDAGTIGELYDVEVRLTTFTPWEIFPHVATHPRLEILYHSIHYIDMIRSFLGNPAGVAARTFRHPKKSFASTRSTILMDYGDTLRAVINTNHDHDFGPHHQESFIKWEGTRGAIKAKMGLLLDYPRGLPDTFEYCISGGADSAEGARAPAETSQPEGAGQPEPEMTPPESGKHPQEPEKASPEWKTVQLEGSWFPDAFIGTMSDLMRYTEGSTTVLPTGIDDVIHTMEVVEKAYESN